MKPHEQIAKLIKESGSKLVSVTFEKKDGSHRQLTFNPKDINDIKGTGSPCPDPNVFRVRDIKLSAWRSFDARRTLSVKVNGVNTTISQEAHQ